MLVQVEQARQSDLAAFPFSLRYVDYRLVGTHEIQEPEAEKHIYDSVLEVGYLGPPIAVFQTGSDDLLSSTHDDSEVRGDYGFVGVADGHHRFKAIRQLGSEGLLQSNLIPVQFIPAHDPNLIRISTLSDNEPPLTINDIEHCFSEFNAVIPQDSTSHFQTRLTTGEWVRLQESQPNINIPHDELISPQL